MVVIRDNWPFLAKIRYTLLMCRIQKWTKLFIISNADKKKSRIKLCQVSLNAEKLSFDDFLMMTCEREVES